MKFVVLMSGFAAISLPHRDHPSGTFQPRVLLAADCTFSFCVTRRAKSHPVMTRRAKFIGNWAMVGCQCPRVYART